MKGFKTISNDKACRRAGETRSGGISMNECTREAKVDLAWKHDWLKTQEVGQVYHLSLGEAIFDPDKKVLFR